MGRVGEKLFLRSTHWEVMLADVRKRDTEEACGLVTGVDQTSSEVFPVTNILHSPVRYRMDPEQQLHCMNQIDENQWDLLAIYHSHLHGPSTPSHTDIAEAYYPGVIYLIWSRMDAEWNCQGYLIENGKVERVPVYRLEDGMNVRE